MKKIILLIFLITSVFAIADKDKSKKSQKKIRDNGQLLQANNVKAIMTNKGWLFWGGGDSGFITPNPVFSDNDGNIASVFASGLWLSGRVNGEVKTSIAYYSTDFAPGKWQTYMDDKDGEGALSNPKWKIYYYYQQAHIDYLQSLLAGPDPTESQKIHQYAQSELDKAATANQEWANEAVLNQGAPANPPGHVAMFTIYHDLNLDEREESVDQKPLNVQIRMLAWSFRQAGPLNNAVFVKMEFINKNAVPITDMYATVWSDPDLGDAADDLVGSDKSLGLGYCYNGNAIDEDYTTKLGVPPPAVGYDYFQGPIVNNTGTNIVQRGEGFKVYLNQDENYSAEPSDVILPNKLIRNATSFYYYNNGDEPSTASGWNNFQKGLTETGSENAVKLDAISAGLTSEEEASFFFNGDPDKGLGWLDSNPDDRRFILNNGPFVLEVSDGTEVFGDPGYNSTVFGVFTSFGGTNTNSVTQLKLDDQVIENAFKKAFDIKPLPPAPKVVVNPEDQALVLNWVEGEVNFKGRTITTESYNEDGYKFMAYEVVQYEKSTQAGSETYQAVDMFDLIDGVLVLKDNISFIEKIVFEGSDSGIKRDIRITTDKFSTKQNPLLLNYTPYHFGVRAIAYNPNPVPGESFVRKGEWAFGLTNLLPKRVDIGTNLSSEYNYSIEFESIGGATDGQVVARVVDPYALRNGNYTIKLYELSSDKEIEGVGLIESGTLVWSLERSLNNSSTILLAGKPQAPAPEEGFGYTYIIDGISWTVSGPPLDMKSFQVVANGDGQIDPPVAGALGFAGFPTPLDGDGDHTNPGNDQQVGGGHWAVHTWPNGSRASYTAFLPRTFGPAGGNVGIASLIPNDFEIRFEAGRGFMNWTDESVVDVPFQLWDIGNIDDPNDDQQLLPYVFDLDGNGQWNLLSEDHEASSADNDPWTDPVYWVRPPEGFTYNTWMDDVENGSHAPEIWSSGDKNNVLSRTVFINWNGTNPGTTVADPTFPANVNQVRPEDGTIFRLITNKINNSDSQFEVVSPGPPDLLNTKLSEANFNKVGVWPNPYYAWHDLQFTSGGFMEFINLPKLDVNGRIPVKIYSLNGDLVRNLIYEGESGTLRWFLDNDSNQKIATGVYFAYLKHRSTSRIIKMLVNIGKNRPRTF